MRLLILAVMLWLSPTLLAAEPTTATVTGKRGGRNVTYVGGLGTEIQGLIVALLGSSNIEREATKKKWEEGLKKERLRVHFAKPQLLAVNVGGDKTYKVSEILLTTSSELLVRSRDKYHSFTKYDGHLWVFFYTRYLNTSKF